MLSSVTLSLATSTCLPALVKGLTTEHISRESPTGTAKVTDLWEPFKQPAKDLEHELQQTLGAQTLSSCPTSQPKYSS